MFVDSSESTKHSFSEGNKSFVHYTYGQWPHLLEQGGPNHAVAHELLKTQIAVSHPLVSGLPSLDQEEQNSENPHV